MKKSIAFLALLMLVILSCSDENTNVTESNSEVPAKKAITNEDKLNGWVNVGKLENDRIVFTANKKNLINSLNDNLLMGKEAYVNEVTIERIKDFYYLLFSGEKIRVTFYVQLSDDGVTLRAAAKTSCSTSDPGCLQEELGCIPQYSDTPAGQSGIGTCTECSNGGTCTKMVSGDTQINP
ncbi:hypothetical protein J4050_12950 [Winogradskyella sp. DF17]|uniref:Lipoprotein n=1 Tax=Winogradskyella pelagia TaxID=2819984 RepID=A0ABS3T4I0_9FLAO|nr:hypothetical protein [Winogradskyella sp. DF17]MBO3117658.1 hypothetical protein [Winogradskyella sp. DF17]